MLSEGWAFFSEEIRVKREEVRGSFASEHCNVAILL
jgi:hypothetical protein